MSQQIIPPYAPGTYGASVSRHQEVNLDQEVKLYSTTKQRELFESLAEIHSIIVTLDYLEKSFYVTLLHTMNILRPVFVSLHSSTVF